MADVTTETTMMHKNVMNKRPEVLVSVTQMDGPSPEVCCTTSGFPLPVSFPFPLSRKATSSVLSTRMVLNVSITPVLKR